MVFKVPSLFSCIFHHPIPQSYTVLSSAAVIVHFWSFNQHVRVLTCKHVAGAFHVEKLWKMGQIIYRCLVSQMILEKRFSQSAAFVAFTLMEYGGVPRYSTPESLLKKALHVIGCGYEDKSEGERRQHNNHSSNFHSYFSITQNLCKHRSEVSVCKIVDHFIPVKA